MKYTYISKGDIIFKEGEPADKMYYISDPSFAEVLIISGYGTPNETLLTTLGCGQSFGEMALISGEPRSATAVAGTDLRLKVITQEDFEAACQGYTVDGDLILRSLSRRLRTLTKDYIKACVALSDYENARNAGDVTAEEKLQALKKLIG